MISPSSRICFIEKFIAHFQPAFSPSQMVTFRNFFYALFIDYKRLSLNALAKQQYFVKFWPFLSIEFL